MGTCCTCCRFADPRRSPLFSFLIEAHLLGSKENKADVQRDVAEKAKGGIVLTWNLCKGSTRLVFLLHRNSFRRRAVSAATCVSYPKIWYCARFRKPLGSFGKKQFKDLNLGHFFLTFSLELPLFLPLLHSLLESDAVGHVTYFHVQPCVRLQLPRFKNRVSLYYYYLFEPLSLHF